MSIGIRLHDVALGTLEERAKIAQAQGFRCAHVALSKTISPAMMEPAVATHGLADQIDRQMNGLKVAVLGCYLNLTHPDEPEYQRILKKYEAQLLLCKWLNAGVVGTETGNPNAEYRYDPQASHTDEALELFIERLRPVVKTAEQLGQIIAIEPVFTHIVSDAARARRVLDRFASPNLRIIFDPVNLLHPSNVAHRDEILAEAMMLLKDEIVVIHLKDYVQTETGLKACAAGTGEMDYRSVLAFAAREKPFIDITLEDTTPQNAEAARATVERILNENM